MHSLHFLYLSHVWEIHYLVSYVLCKILLKEGMLPFIAFWAKFVVLKQVSAISMEFLCIQITGQCQGNLVENKTLFRI